MDREKYFEDKSIKGRYEKAIASETAKALIYFCDQAPEFEQAIEQSGKTFQECLTSICKGVGASQSDFKTYNKAVKFYFSTATVHYDMRIDLSGDNGHKDPAIKMIQSKAKEKSGLNISLDELLNF